jgi:flagellar motor switch protein FliN/FliY
MAETAEATVVMTEEQQDQGDQKDQKTQAQSAEFAEVTETNATGSGASLDILLDMEIPVTVTIGQTELSIQRLLQLGPGSVLKLDKSIEAPADLYLKDTRFATGDIVIIEDKFAIRIKSSLGSGDAADANN